MARKCWCWVTKSATQKLITIIIPTWNNRQYLEPCIRSIMQTGILNGFAELLIIDNGEEKLAHYYKDIPGVRVLTPGKNLGWEGGLELGVSQSDRDWETI